MREDGKLIKSRKSGDGKQWLDSRLILEVEQTRFADGLDEVYKRKREVKNDSKAFGLSQTGEQKCWDMGCRGIGTFWESIIKNCSGHVTRHPKWRCLKGSWILRSLGRSHHHEYPPHFHFPRDRLWCLNDIFQLKYCLAPYDLDPGGPGWMSGKRGND